VSQISRDEIARVAMLGRLSFDESQIDRLRGELASILEYVQKLDELDTAGVEPFTHPNPMTNVFRDDRTTASLPQDEALANAPSADGGRFSVPKILGGH